MNRETFEKRSGEWNQGHSTGSRPGALHRSLSDLSAGSQHQGHSTRVRGKMDRGEANVDATLSGIVAAGMEAGSLDEVRYEVLFFVEMGIMRYSALLHWAGSPAEKAAILGTKRANKGEIAPLQGLGQTRK